MYKFDEQLINYIKKYKYVLAFTLITIIGLLIRCSCINFASDDYNSFLGPWLNQIKKDGGLAFLKSGVCDYNIPYRLILIVIAYLPIDGLVAVKMVSILFDFVGATGAALLVKHCVPCEKKMERSFLVYSLIMLSPVIILNSGFWAQCDMMYVSILIFSVLLFTKEKFFTSFILLGISYCIKQQAIFIIPVYLIYYFITCKFTILNFLIIPIQYILSVLPAVICGSSLIKAMGIYLIQIVEYKKLTLNFPNLYYIFTGTGLSLFNFAIGITIGILGIGAVWFIEHKKKMIPIDVIQLVIWVGMTCVMFLPRMHERYGFLVEVFVIIYVVIKNTHWWIAIGVNLVTLINYNQYLFHEILIDIKFLSIANLILYFLFTREVFRGKEDELPSISEYRCGN